MLLQHYNYLAIKAAQKPHYGQSWGLVGLRRISGSSFSILRQKSFLSDVTQCGSTCAGVGVLNGRDVANGAILILCLWINNKSLKKKKLTNLSITFVAAHYLNLCCCSYNVRIVSYFDHKKNLLCKNKQKKQIITKCHRFSTINLLSFIY